MYTILHTIETGGPGGAETILLKLASQLDQTRFRSIVLLPRRGWLHSQLEKTNVPTFFVQSNAWYDLRLPRTLVALARREKVDLIHSHLPDQNFYSSLVRPLAGCKVVVTYHGSQQISEPSVLSRVILNNPLAPLGERVASVASRVRGSPRGNTIVKNYVEHHTSSLKAALKLAVVKRRASAVVVVSDYLKQKLLAAGFPSDRVIRIHNGIDPVDISEEARAGLRESLGCVNGTPLVGTVANIRESKGYDYFLRAARLVTDRMPEVRFAAAGEADPELSRRLFSLRQELELEKHVQFLGFRQDVDRLLAAFDVFVLPSVSEGFSLATVEAMAAGRPVIATRSGGPEELIEDGVTGFLVPRRDPESLAAKICELLTHPPLAAALGQNARAAVQSKFALARMVDEYARVYEKVISGQ
jgi:glycosyltransferase involved in cell wall biosynthesis